MKVNVLRSFPMAVDKMGVKVRDLIAGTVDEIHEDNFASLEAEGYVSVAGRETKIEPPLETGAPQPIEIDAPADDDADLVEAMTEAELRAYLTKRDGKAPHHKLKMASLLALAKGE